MTIGYNTLVLGVTVGKLEFETYFCHDGFFAVRSSIAQHLVRPGDGVIPALSRESAGQTLKLRILYEFCSSRESIYNARSVPDWFERYIGDNVIVYTPPEAPIRASRSSRPLVMVD